MLTKISQQSEKEIENFISQTENYKLGDGLSASEDCSEWGGWQIYDFDNRACACCKHTSWQKVAINSEKHIYFS